MADGGCTLPRRSAPHSTGRAFPIPHPISAIPHPPPLLVLDTNLLVGAAYAPRSASGRLLAAAADRRVRWAVSPAVFAEYRFIVPRAVRRPGGVAAVLAALRTAVPVVPSAEEDGAARGVSEDPDDDKFLALAAAAGGGAGADALLSNDRHLLDVGTYRGVPVARPGDWLRHRPD